MDEIPKFRLEDIKLEKPIHVRPKIFASAKIPKKENNGINIGNCSCEDYEPCSTECNVYCIEY